MRLWRVSSLPWSKQCESTRWFNAGTTSIVVYYASPLAAICARLLEQRLPIPELMSDGERLYSVEVNRYLIQTAPVSSRWHTNLKETRDLTAVWRIHAKEPVLRVPSMNGSAQYLINLRSPLLEQIRVYRSGGRAFKRSLREAQQYLVDGAEWLAVP